VWPSGSVATRPRGVVLRYPPTGVLRESSRSVPGSCRGAVPPLTGRAPTRLQLPGKATCIILACGQHPQPL